MRLTVFAAHVDNESQGIADANWSSHSSSSGPVTVSDFHVALRRLQGEDYGISRGNPGRRWVRNRQEECVSVSSRAQHVLLRAGRIAQMLDIIVDIT